MEEFEKLYNTGWSDWKSFPDPRKGEYLTAPLGSGVYQLRNKKIDKYDPNKLTYLRITDINDDGTINRAGLMSVDEPNASDYILYKNDLVFARTRNSTGRAYFYQGTECPLVYAGFLIKFSIDENKVNPRLLKYYTHSQPYYDGVKSFDTGGTRGNINAKTYGNMPVCLPSSRKMQDRIVEILSSLDSKIELNRRINDNLEQQAQALFEHYFVENTDLLGDVTVGGLTQIASYVNGLAMQRFRPNDSETGLPVLKIKELGQNSIDSASDKCTHDIDDIYKVFDGDVAFSWSGTLMVKVWTGGNCGLNQHLFKVTSQTYPKWFYYFWTKHHLDRFIRIAQDKAVTMGHIKRGDLEASKVLIPCEKKLNQISERITPLFEKSITCSIENRYLAEIRETLLPKLMSGELKTNEINC